jgi:hypothetical protein
MTKKVIPDKNDFYKKHGFIKEFYENKEVDIDQLNLFQDLDDRYTVPSVLESVTAILTHYVRRGEMLYETKLLGMRAPCDIAEKESFLTVCKDKNPETHEPFYVGNFDFIEDEVGHYHSYPSLVTYLETELHIGGDTWWRGGVAGVQRLPSASD